jgi:hypothetical protein
VTDLLAIDPAPWVPHLVDGILGLLLLEGVVLLCLRPRPRLLLWSVASGGALLMAWRFSAAGASGWLALACLALAGSCHAAELLACRRAERRA